MDHNTTNYVYVTCSSCLDDVLPCSGTVTGNLFLMIVYGYIIARGSKLLADGTELLMDILDPGFIGGFLLPVLGALPDSVIIFVSGFSADAELAKDQIAVGMGTLAGSSIMLLTFAWGARIISVVPYFLIQGIAFRDAARHSSDARSRSDEAPIEVATIALTLVLFLAYSVYMVMNTKAQAVRLAAAKKKRMLDKLADMFNEKIIDKEGFTAKDDYSSEEPMRSERVSLLDNAADIDGSIEMGDKYVNPHASFQISRINDDVLKVVGQWKNEVNLGEFKTDGDEEQQSHKLSKAQILIRSLAMMAIGIGFVIIFSSPLVNVISTFSTEIRIPTFYTAFIVTPFISNASEIITSLMFASKKRKKNISLTFGALYGSVSMNNTLCLAVFLLIIYTRKLLWTFSAEVLSIVLVVVLMGLITSFKTNFRTWMSLLAFSFYPLALGFVIILKGILKS